MRGNFLIGLVLAVFLAAEPGFAADSILDGAQPNPCADSPNYVPGVDVGGQPVARADEGARPVPVPDQIMVPLPGSGPNQRPGQRGGRQPGGGPYGVIAGPRLDQLLNPRPCQAAPDRAAAPGQR